MRYPYIKAALHCKYSKSHTLFRSTKSYEPRALVHVRYVLMCNVNKRLTHHTYIIAYAHFLLYYSENDIRQYDLKSAIKTFNTKDLRIVAAYFSFMIINHCTWIVDAYMCKCLTS